MIEEILLKAMCGIPHEIISEAGLALFESDTKDGKQDQKQEKIDASDLPYYSQKDSHEIYKTSP